MAMSFKRAPFAALPMLALAACSTVDPRTGSVDRQFGEAVAWNKAVQTIDPDPVYTADAAQAGSDGGKAAAASQRYRTDRVKRVERVSTSQGSGGGGSGPQ
jgi:hypothetical protein